jgi:hypothetical protein
MQVGMHCFVWNDGQSRAAIETASILQDLRARVAAGTLDV